MRSLTTIALATISTLALTSTAFAGTSVTNSTTTRNSVGNVNTDLSVVKNVSGVQTNYSQSLKMESLAPNSFAQVNFNGGQLTGTAWGSTNTPVDPYAIGTYSSQTEVLNVSEAIKVNTIEKATFTEVGVDHTVSSDSF